MELMPHWVHHLEQFFSSHWVHHLEHFLAWFLSSKEFWAAILGAVIGGWMTSRSALRAQKQAAKDQRQRDREIERRAINGTLRAIKTELETFHGLVEETDEILKKWQREHESPAHRMPLNLPSITQNHFIVFDASASALGRIKNDDLRKKILGAFYEAKSLIEAINSLHQKYQSYEALSRVGRALDQPETNQFTTLKADLIRLTNEDISPRLLRLKKKVPNLLNDIEKYLGS